MNDHRIVTKKYPHFDLTKIEIEFQSLPSGFNNTVLVHISDLHNRQFGKAQRYLVDFISSLKPHYIFITGDMIDQHHKSISAVQELIEGIYRLAPIYYVTGNHEWQTGQKREELLSLMRKKKIHILSDTIEQIEREKDVIQIMGLDDPYKAPKQKKERFYEKKVNQEYIQRFKYLCDEKKELFTILLSHRPEFISLYSESKINIVFSGHAHGGAIRIPKLGGLIAPHQGLFPQYCEGITRVGDTEFIVSRGLGYSGIPFRINNRPEVIVTKLKCKEYKANLETRIN